MSVFITNAIPYVNGDPHVGHALEFVQADVLARHARLRGDAVRFQSGTDDNSLKNVLAAEAAGFPVDTFVNAKAGRFAALREPLELSYDDFIRTSVDARHRSGVERLWRACAGAGDLYQRDYEGLYCAGCEAFVEAACAEHPGSAERVAERNWFFRLSRYQDELLELLESDRLRIEPAQRRNEVLAFVRGGLEDFSVSRSDARARGWGLRVPDDPTQVVAVWFDALANYVTALGYGTGDESYRTWWLEAAERLHVIGKGIVRFHAVYWPAILLSAGEPLPTAVFVHEYLTESGAKISKSAGGTSDPAELAARYGDALRWWLVRDVSRLGDTDFREELLVARANELANELGNLVNRTITLVRRFRPDGARPAAAPEGGSALRDALDRAPGAIDEALARFDLRSAADAVWRIVVDANRFVSATRPWQLDGEALDAVLALLVEACETIAVELRPFLPGAAARIEEAVARGAPELGRALFAKA